MKTFQQRLPFLLFVVVAFHGAQAEPASSTSYGMPACTADAGGARAISAAYGNSGSTGGITGLASANAASETAKLGYMGQLYEVTALQLAATPPTVNEGGTRQITTAELLDDLTTLPVPAGSITWSVQSGPVTGISSGGLATAGLVFQDTNATVQGTFGGHSGSLILTVLNVSNDDLPGYSGDGIDDAWQMQYFGANNPNAAPGHYSDGSGLTNLFKYTAGLIPNNAASRFVLDVQPMTGQPTQRGITFSPSLTDRQYTVEVSTDLVHWSTLSGPAAGTGTSSTVTDTSVDTAPHFYRVQISRP